jgi:hypothetical protein
MRFDYTRFGPVNKSTPTKKTRKVQSPRVFFSMYYSMY